MLLYLFLCQRKCEDKFGSHAFRADDVDMFFVSLNDFFDNGQSKTGAFFVFSAGEVGFVKTIPDFFDAFRRNANAGIFDGDQVLVKKQAIAEDGDIVVALVDDGATVKTFHKEKGYYRLQPENDYMEPIIVYGELQILGKVIGVFRFMR